MSAIPSWFKLFIIAAAIWFIFWLIRQAAGGASGAARAPRPCSRCGTTQPMHARYCRRCGNELSR